MERAFKAWDPQRKFRLLVDEFVDACEAIGYKKGGKKLFTSRRVRCFGHVLSGVSFVFCILSSAIFG